MKPKKKKKISSLTEKEVLKRYRDNSHFMTVKSLKNFIDENNMPDDALVMIERVEDIYYENHGWSVLLKENEHTHWVRKFNKEMKNEIKRRKSGNEPKYDKIKNPKKYITEITDDMKNQYHPAWSCVGYKDKRFLFIDLHY